MFKYFHKNLATNFLGSVHSSDVATAIPPGEFSSFRSFVVGLYLKIPMLSKKTLNISFLLMMCPKLQAVLLFTDEYSFLHCRKRSCRTSSGTQ